MLSSIRRSKITQWLLKNPVLVTLFISLVILTITILFIGHLRPFNSDDIYWQQDLRSWKPFNGDTLYLATKDTFVELVPFFAIMGVLFSPSRALVIIEVLILTAITFVFIYLSMLYFLKKLRVKPSYISLTPFIWLASFGFPIVDDYLNSDWRTFEVGIVFLTFVFAAAICFGDFDPLASIRNRILSILALIYIGVIAYSDPYYVYFALGPIAVFICLLYFAKKIKKTEFLVICGGILIAIVLSYVTSFVLKKAGISVITETPSVFIGFDSIWTNIISSLHGLLIIFNADFFGRTIAKTSTFIAILNALLVGVITNRIYNLKNSFRFSILKKTELSDLWMRFLILVIAVVFVVYTSSSLVVVGNYRFFIELVFCAVVFLSLDLAISKNSHYRQIVASLLIIVAFTNIAQTTLSKSIVSQPSVAINTSNSVNFSIINGVEKEGLTKGFSGYWEGNINSYLAGGKVGFLPVVCADGSVTKPFKWLINSGQYKRQSDRSFYVFDPDYPLPPVCTIKQLVAQFGKPVKTLYIGNKQILIYNYDISKKMVDNWMP